MEKRIAIITGASGGIGKEFAKLMLQEEVDEIWAIARKQEKLTALRKELGDKIVAISKDLSKTFRCSNSRLLYIPNSMEDNCEIIEKYGILSSGTLEHSASGGIRNGDAIFSRR